MPEPTSGLRERIEASFGPAMRLGLQDAELFDGPGAERIEEWIAHITDQVLTALATDPGNLPARMAEVIGSHEWTEFPRSAHNQHNYYAECAVCQRDIPRIAEVALGVRDELAAHLSARAAEAEAKVEHAEAGAELSSERLAKVRQELAEALNLSGIRAKLLREAWDAHHDTMDELDSLRRKLTAKEAEADGLNRDREGWRTRTDEAEATTERVSKWVTSDVVTAKSSFGDGYREAQRDIRDLMTAPVEGTTTPARETA